MAQDGSREDAQYPRLFWHPLGAFYRHRRPSFPLATAASPPRRACPRRAALRILCPRLLALTLLRLRLAVVVLPWAGQLPARQLLAPLQGPPQRSRPVRLSPPLPAPRLTQTPCLRQNAALPAAGPGASPAGALCLLLHPSSPRPISAVHGETPADSSAGAVCQRRCCLAAARPGRLRAWRRAGSGAAPDPGSRGWTSPRHSRQASDLSRCPPPRPASARAPAPRHPPMPWAHTKRAPGAC